MDAVKLQAQRDLDHDILFYVREVQKIAPVTEESVHGFVTAQRRRRVTRSDIADRLDYLASSGCLEKHTEWQAGEGNVDYWKITAKGMDILDGNIPPLNWKPNL
jgi:hypothetical protein